MSSSTRTVTHSPSLSLASATYQCTCCDTNYITDTQSTYYPLTRPGTIYLPVIQTRPNVAHTTLRIISPTPFRMYNFLLVLYKSTLLASPTDVRHVQKVATKSYRWSSMSKDGPLIKSAGWGNVIKIITTP